MRLARPIRRRTLGVAAELELAEATVYRWKAQDLIDRGVKPGTSTSERGELAAARQRIKELETELALAKHGLPGARTAFRSKVNIATHLPPCQVVRRS